MSAEQPTPEEFARHIAESVAALDLLKSQICGMYAVLQQRDKNRSENVQALVDAEVKLQGLLGQFPKDPITLAGIQSATGRIEQVALDIPKEIRTFMFKGVEAMATAFANKTEPQVNAIGAAANEATLAANGYALTRKRSVYVPAAVAGVTALVVAAILAVAAVWWWVPARADIEAQRSEIKQMEETIATLKKDGGLAQLVPCDTHLCVRTDETVKTPKISNLPKGDTYRVIKGY